MADDPRVEDLLDELLDSNAAPEEVCGSDPDLLPVVRNRWRQMRRLRADLNELFPPSDDRTPFPSEGTDLPHIPGYEVESVLGRGGMGVVFRARHLRLNRPVAVKTVLDGGYAGPRERARFQREAEAVATLRHPNVVQIYDVGEEQGRPYLAMELIEGGSLAQELSGTPQSAHLAAALVATLADAMQAAHDAGIVHRDLKPANILLAAGCTPKISDFGLARRLEGEAGLTQSGVPVGTPSYMAPEQARGRTNSVGPAADVYSLGAILYECLTGRPPFRAATAAETIQQVISQEPAPPSRLNDKVPGDLDTVCLKCLSKEPDRRYASAAALAEDLRRFAEGRPIRARPVGLAERSWRWGRRNPMAAALVATAVALVALTSGAGAWIALQSARHERDLRKGVSAALPQAMSLRQQYHFDKARDLLEIAGKRLEPAGPDDLRQQVKQSRADLDLAELLDAARVKAAMLGGKFDPARAEPLYVSAFAEAGLGREGDDVEAVAARARDSPVRAEIVAALDDWASTTPDRGRRAWLLAVARAADPDPARDRLRQPELWGDVDRLTSLAKEPRLAESLSPQLATALGRVSREKGGEAMALLTAVHAQFPQDFWVNFELGSALYEANRWDEALGYLRAALSLRPTASLAHQALGETLRRLGRVDEAIDSLREALRIDPDFVWGHICLGLALRDGGRRDEAIEQYQQALRIDPNSVPAHVDLGRAFYETRRLDEALDQYQQALQIDPKSDIVRVDLGNALYVKGRRDEAMDQYEQALRINPKSSEPHVHIGIVLSKEGQMPEAVGHFEQALGMDPESERLKAWLGATRYRAACAAVLKATGPGSKNGHPGDTERAVLRRQALGWLRANLELIKQANHGKLVMTSLSTWQQERALASVRNPAELATLPTEEREAWQQLWADVAAIIAIHPLEQGYVQAARGQWNLAADAYARYSRVIKPGPTYGHFRFEYAALSLLSGDRTGYTKACSHMVEEIGKPGGPRAYHIARACTLAPDAVTDPTLPGRLAATELQASAKEFWSLTEQGALAYRASRFQESVPLFEQSLQANSKPGAAVLNWLWLALANQRLGKTEEARRWLDKAQAWLDQFGDGMPAGAEQKFVLDLHNWLEAHVLRREAEALIRPTGVRSGTAGAERSPQEK